MLITVGTKLISKQSLYKIGAGDHCEVVVLTKDGMALIQCGKHLAWMQVGDVFRAFDIFIGSSIASQHVWSEWKNGHCVLGEYKWRTNGKRTDVEMFYLGRARTSCSPYDKFDQQKGIDIAIAKILYAANQEIIAKWNEVYAHDKQMIDILREVLRPKA